MTQERPLLVKRETAPTRKGLGASQQQRSSARSHLIRLTRATFSSLSFHHRLPPATSASGCKPVPLGSGHDGHPSTQTGDRRDHQHSPLLGPRQRWLSSQTSPPPRGRRRRSPGYLARVPTNDRSSAPGGNKIRGSSESFSVANRIRK